MRLIDADAIVFTHAMARSIEDGHNWNELCVTKDEIDDMPSAGPEIITIEEVSNQLGCATIQSALYWFEFLKTLDLLGFAIIRKETR